MPRNSTSSPLSRHGMPAVRTLSAAKLRRGAFPGDRQSRRLPLRLGRLARRLQQMVGFRNILVHEYARTNLAIVRDVLENRMGDLSEFRGAGPREARPLADRTR